MSQFILGSQSKRRKDLLLKFGYEFKILPAYVDESISISCKTESAIKKEVILLALKKALSIEADLPVVAADTVVVFKNRIFGKPRDPQEAFRMLKLLSRKWHKVHTGVCVLNKNKRVVKKFCETTKVKFRALSDTEILEYIDTGEPMDKAGSYGIQGYGGLFVEKIAGCYFNVVGLPVPRLAVALKKIGIFPLMSVVRKSEP